MMKRLKNWICDYKSNREAAILLVQGYVLAVLITPLPAYAAVDAEGIVQSAVDFLTGGVARGGAVAVLAIMGWMVWFGRLSMEIFVRFIIGAILIFGSAAIVAKFL